MRRDLCAYLWDIRRAAEDLVTFTASLSFEQYLQTRMVQAAVERKFEIIGEALSQASRHFPGKLDAIPDLSDAIGQRHRIAHGYFALDQKKLWDAIQADIPKLRSCAQQLLDQNCEEH